MFHVIAIESVPSPEAGESRYEIRVIVDGEERTFPAEVRPAPKGVQLDWSDEFQDLLMLHGADFVVMNRLLYEAHEGVAALPVALGRPMASNEI